MEPVDYFSPFFGVDGGGNCLCGPFLPFGMARPGPDTTIPHPPSGYRSGERIIRFSQNHVSGTGGGGRYGNLALTPYLNREDCRTGYQPQNEQASAGCYRVDLVPSGIRAELTSTRRVAVHRYHYPIGVDGGVLLDLGSIIETGMDNDKKPVSLGGYAEIVSDREIVGRVDYQGGWGHNYPYTIFFALQCNQSWQRWELESAATVPGEANCVTGSHCMAWLEFDRPETMEIRIALSLVSIGMARKHLEEETSGKSFDQLVADARSVWSGWLNKITVEDGKEEDKKLFYSAFGRLICMPGDLGVDEENPLWQSGVRQFTDFYCLWDSVRNANSLLALIAPQLSADMLNALLDIGQHTGWIPDAWIAGHSAQIQGGCSADVLFSEFARKEIPGIDYCAALKQMLKTRRVKSPDPRLYGRYLDHYRDLGYVSTDSPAGTSRHIEYAYQDWCAAELAHQLGETELEGEFRAGATKIWNLWRDDHRCFAPRHPDGSWFEPFDPWQPTRPDYWYDPYFYEGTAAEWSLCALHVIDDIMARHGGPNGFVRHLDYFFDHIFIWKEIILHTPYLYLLAGRPDKTADTVNRLLRQKYHPGRDGLPDNEDMGAHAAFIMCSMLGIYPLPGQTRYMLSTPYFRRARVELDGTDRILRITADQSQSTHPYVKDITFNGKPLVHPWLEHEQLVHGGELHFRLSSTPEWL